MARSVTRLVVILALAAGCSTSQYVRFEEPRGAEVRIPDSPDAEGRDDSRVPGTWSIKTGRVYACSIRFDRETLRKLRLTDEEIDELERENRMTLDGGLVAFEAAERGQTVLIGIEPRIVRSALLRDEVVVAWGTDDTGEARVLLKVSADGVPLDDPELAPHGGPVKGALVVAGNVCIVAGKVALYTAYVAAEVLLRASCH